MKDRGFLLATLYFPLYTLEYFLRARGLGRQTSQAGNSILFGLVAQW